MAAEDTRRTGVLLDHIGHRAPRLVSLHEHNEGRASAGLIESLVNGQDVALVSDAGTPLINDPGFELVRLAHEAGVRTIPLPGACSIITALSVCPLPCHPFRFIGFLPARAQARETTIAQAWASGDATVFLEAPHRIADTLAAMAELTLAQAKRSGKAGRQATRADESTAPRRIMLARELTKQFESVLVGSPAEVREALLSHLPQPRGEFVGVIEASDMPSASFTERRVLSALLKDLPPTQAARLAANICGVKKSAMYQLALKLQQS